MPFKLSSRSLGRLAGVHDDLVSVVERAIQITEVDFTVLEGLRSQSRQKELFASGATTTMNSRHLTGHAVDLGAWVTGGIRWDWPLYHKIAAAMKQAADELGVAIEWGAAWSRHLSDYPDADTASEEYIKERQSQGRKPFLDGPHFQLPWSEYPA